MNQSNLNLDNHDILSELDKLNEEIQLIQVTNSKEAIHMCIAYLDKAKKEHSIEHIIYANYLMAYNLTNKGSYTEAIRYYDDCLEALDDSSNEMYFKVHNGLGMIYKQMGEYKKALSSYYIALNGNVPSQLAAILNNISIVYRDLDQLDKAIEYSNKAFEQTINKDNIVNSLTILTNIGKYKILQKNYVEAEEILFKSKQIAQEHQLTNQVINCDFKIASLYYEQEKYAESLELLKEVLTTTDEYNYQLLRFGVKILLAKVYDKLNYKDEAAQIYEYLIFAHKDDNIHNYLLAVSNYIELLEESKEFEKICQLQKIYIETLIKINLKEKEESIQNSKLLIENKEQELELLRLREVKGLNKILADNTILLEEKQNKLEEINNDLMHFSYALSHDLKEPVRMIKSFSDMLSTLLAKKLSEEEKQMFHYITNGAQKTVLLIDELQKYAKLGVTEDMKKEINLNHILKDTIQLLHKNIEDNKTIINFEELPVIYSYPIFFNQLFQNLITNAIKYKQKEMSPIITISYTKLANEHEIVFADNGIGIPVREQSKIFSLFKRASNHSIKDGTGVGLAFCAKIMTKLNGSIIVESEGENTGSKFIVRFPMSE